MEHPAKRSLRLRLALAVVTAALVGVLLERGVAVARPDSPLLSILLGLSAMAAVGLAAAERVLSGMLRSHSDLQTRYETAMEEALTDR